MDKDDDYFRIVEDDNARTAKEKWIKPSFEIISKDIVRSGVNAGPEGAGYTSDIAQFS